MKLLEIYHDKIIGAIKGLDRIRFRGTLRGISDSVGVSMFMSAAGLLLKDFKAFVESKTMALRAGCERRVDELGIPKIYLNSSNVDKEALARKVAAENRIANGPICLFSVVEPCMAPQVNGIELPKKWLCRVKILYLPAKKAFSVSLCLGDFVVGSGFRSLQRDEYPLP